MGEIKKITLCLDMENGQDKNILKEIMDFGKKHNQSDESSALKSFIVYLHFLGVDMKALSNKISDIS